MADLASVLDSLVGDDLHALPAGVQLDRLRELARARNRLDAEIARSVRVAIRTPPHVVPRQAVGLPAQLIGIALKRLPSTVGDAITAAIARVFIGDLTRHGLARPEDGLVTRYRSRSALPPAEGITNTSPSGL